MATDYEKLVLDTLKRIEQVHDEREGLESELVRLEQLVIAASGFVDSPTQQAIKDRLEIMRDRASIRKVGLSEAIDIVLRNAEKPLTVSEVRDRLVRGGFDFSEYASNPLASISTTLKRMKESRLDVFSPSNKERATTWIIFPAKRKKKTEDAIEGALKNALEALEGPSKKG